MGTLRSRVIVAVILAVIVMVVIAMKDTSTVSAATRKRTTTRAKRRVTSTTRSTTVAKTNTMLGVPSSVAVSVPHEQPNDLALPDSGVIDITLADNRSVGGTGVSVEANTVTIREPGMYRLTGSLTDGQVIINAPDATVRLLLDKVSIASLTTAPLEVISARKIILITGKGTVNNLTDGARALAVDAEPDAALFSRSDLTLAGEGTLNVTGRAADAIASKDGLLIAGGTINAVAVDDAIRAKDYLIVRGGTIDASANSGDGLKATESDDLTRGHLTIAGGTITVTAGDDAIHAEAKLSIAGGSIVIKQSREGLEGKIIDLSGGSAIVAASDDAINAADGTGGRLTGGRNRGQVDDSRYFTMSGGRFDITGGADGLDANGNATITGGQLFANGPSSRGSGAIDADGTITVTGGLVIAVGSARFDSGPSGNQPSVEFTLEAQQTSGTAVQIRNAQGKVIGTYRAGVDFDSVAVSAPTLKAGETYTIHVGGQPTGSSFGKYFPNSAITTSKSSGSAVAS